MERFQDLPYQRVDFDLVYQKMEQLMESFRQSVDGEAQFEVHKQFYKLDDEVATYSTIAKIRHDVDTKDEFYKTEQEYYDVNLPKYNALTVAYQKLLFESPWRKELEAHIGRVAFKNIEISMKSVDDKLIPLMQEENALKTEYDKVIAGARIDWKGEECNLSLMKPYMTASDREVRQDAWKKVDDFFLEKASVLDDLYDQLVKNRTRQAQMMGYENYLQLGYYRMRRNCYDQKMVENYRNQVKEYLVPLAEQIHEDRRIRLGLDHLRFIDEGVYFKQGNPVPTGTPEEIMRAGQKMYRELSPETGEFFDFMMEHELFDVLGRKSKRAGGYMTYLPLYHAPFIFANFNGTSGDVDVITHECGHAFQGYLIADDPIREHADITMETAEIHSMSMEFFTSRWRELFFGSRAADYEQMHLEDSIAFIPYGCTVDEFQHEVYAHPEMTPEERNTCWSHMEKTYKPHLNYEGSRRFASGGFWQKQLHIYDYPLYYIDYCLAQTVALQYKAKMDQNFDAAWKSYLKLCRLSASDFYTGLLKQVGMESPFEDGCLKKLVVHYTR